MIKQYVDRFSTFHFDEDEDRDPQTAKELRHGALSLEQYIHTLYPNVPCLSTDNQIKTLLERDYKSGLSTCEKRLIEESCQLAKTARTAGTGPNNSWYDFEKFSDLRECVQPLGSTQKWDAGTSSLWPLVKRIRISIKGQDLLQNIIIGDAPGIFDINQIRADNCKEYLRDCDYVLIVEHVRIRIASDKQMDELLSNYGERFNGQLAIVITHIDARTQLHY